MQERQAFKQQQVENAAWLGLIIYLVSLLKLLWCRMELNVVWYVKALDKSCLWVGMTPRCPHSFQTKFLYRLQQF